MSADKYSEGYGGIFNSMKGCLEYKPEQCNIPGAEPKDIAAILVSVLNCTDRR